ncbi:TlpA family protein disulfide reductase [Lutibacter sp. A80]|uniref:TlpA disulfide reductase family protein n=1 Tax=Lutibacter sp. A80 TaxID=2918453 RepID=UPI001F056640|nr:TlpA disulfide reductase family protein [Lutibacter sp. A80]UMB62212.1 TlpA family protein disulfide reductase [Lutibacter sp. A80]
MDFWASWCVPCRKGNPHLLDIYAKYKSKGLEILGVSDDDRNPNAWRKAVKDDEIGVWRHVLRGIKVDRSNGMYKVLDDGVSRDYNISSLPTKILVGPDGIIIGRYNGGKDDDDKMDKKLIEIFENNTAL